MKLAKRLVLHPQRRHTDVYALALQYKSINQVCITFALTPPALQNFHHLSHGQLGLTSFSNQQCFPLSHLLHD